MTTIQPTARLRIHADCPYCGGSNELAHGREILKGEAEGWYDNQWNGGEGGYRVLCLSCGKPFAIEREAVRQTLEHTVLVLIGEADAARKPTAPREANR